MKRFFHKLFRRHEFEQFTLKYTRHDCGPKGEVFYIGYRCDCGEPGYEVPA